jgi:hypothetical protein
VKTFHPVAYVLGSLLFSACGENGPTRFVPLDSATTLDADDASTDDGTKIDVPVVIDRGVIPIRDSGEPQGETIVYAHSDDALFAVDPASRSVRRIAAFMFPSDGNNHSMTDLAVNADGRITGVTQDALYTIDPNTARCTLVRALPTTDRRVFVGLTWLPQGALDTANEVLLGGATDGSLWRIDPSTGRTTMVGMLSTGWGVSGDIVSIAGDTTYATVRRTTGTSTTDSLATITFRPSVRMTVVGEVGFRSIYGLGYWRQTLYGFTRAGELVTIAPRTGRGTRVSMPTTEFSGAGVTTVAPTAPP